MLSGVEIAGLILGSLPLAIQAVEWYAQGVKPMEEYWSYGPALQLLQGRLNFQATLYEDTIRRLLILSRISANEIHILMDSLDEPWGASEAWAKDELAEKLQETLGKRHFDSFIFAIQRIEELMKELMAKLRLDAKGKPKYLPDGASFRSVSIQDFRPRLQYEWRKIARTFSMKKQEKLIEDFKEYNSAIAAFVLNKEILAPQNEDKNAMQSKTLVKYFDLVRTEACSLYEVLEKDLKCSCNDPHDVNLQLSFREMQQGTRLQCYLQHLHQDPTDGIMWTSLDWKIIAEPDDSLRSHNPTVHHLRSLLEKDQNRSRRASRFSGLTEKQRRQIAVALSYSVLQFYDSPWMHDLWGEEDIYFFTSENQFKRLEVSDPSLSHAFPKHQIQERRKNQLQTQFVDVHIPNKPLFALGIVLLELCLNMTFFELHDISSLEPEEQPDAIEKYRIVMENLDSAFDEWGETFGQVVQRCLNPEFGFRPSEKRMDFDKFRCRVYEGIVAPLEEDLKLFK